jgi:hypothetical protein
MIPNKMILFSFVFSFFLFSNSLISSDKENSKNCFKDVEKLRGTTSPKLFSFDLDIQLGLSFSSSNFELNKNDSNSSALVNANSKVGPSIGATVSLNLLGFGFSTGIVYTGKGFKTASNSNYNLHYFVVPWLIYFDIDLSKVRINGNFGPYAGILLSQKAYTSAYGNELFVPKNVDFGLTGNIQGTYYFTKILGVLLGVKYEYGGLNNLVSNEYVKSLHTSTFFTYTGLKISL